MFRPLLGHLQAL